jgi:3-isopropylmalate dehydrogenase
MLRYSFNLEKEALAVENSVEQILNKGYRTKDIMEEDKILVSTEEMGTLVMEKV